MQHVLTKFWGSSLFVFFCFCVFAPFAQRANCEDGWFEADGIRLDYRSEGQGEVVLLLPGIAGSTRDWDDFVLQHPQRVISLARVSSLGSFEQSDKDRSANELLIQAFRGYEAAAARIIIDETPAGQPKPSQEEAQQIAREFLSTVGDGEALAALMQTASPSDPDAATVKHEKIATNSIPVLVVYGVASNQAVFCPAHPGRHSHHRGCRPPEY